MKDSPGSGGVFAILSFCAPEEQTRPKSFSGLIQAQLVALQPKPTIIRALETRHQNWSRTKIPKATSLLPSFHRFSPSFDNSFDRQLPRGIFGRLTDSPGRHWENLTRRYPPCRVCVSFVFVGVQVFAVLFELKSLKKTSSKVCENPFQKLPRVSFNGNNTSQRTTTKTGARVFSTHKSTERKPNHTHTQRGDENGHGDTNETRTKRTQSTTTTTTCVNT